MIFQTPILALLLVAGLAALAGTWAAGFALRVLRGWDLARATPRQIAMERATELVSTLFAAVMLAELAALLLFVFNADRMAGLFVGAMCAVGTLSVNAYGFPALYAKIAVFFGAGLWLMLDRADRMGRDYPLTRVKYAALLALVPVIWLDFGLELGYFLGLKTDVITSCCSKLFTPANPGLADDMAALAPGAALWLLGGAGALVAALGALVHRTGRFYGLFALGGAGFFAAALVAIVAVISPYIYEHPTHHCPFCILKPEYGYYGYLLYIPLFLGTALALGAGAVAPFARRESLSARLPGVLRAQARGAVICYAAFGAATLWAIARSGLILFG